MLSGVTGEGAQAAHWYTLVSLPADSINWWLEGGEAGAVKHLAFFL